MPRFDVYTAATTPHLLLDVQADLLSDFATANSSQRDAEDGVDVLIVDAVELV